jgi:hypothetical protein
MDCLRILTARSHATQDDVHPCDEFARAEGLGDIVVAADLQTQYAIDLVVAGGEKKDRHVRGLSDFAADVQAVEFRHADIQNDQIRPVGGKSGQCFLAVAGLEDSHPAFFSATRMTSRMCRSSSTMRMRCVKGLSGKSY